MFKVMIDYGSTSWLTLMQHMVSNVRQVSNCICFCYRSHVMYCQ